jgi:proline dehydrogenase
MMGGGTPSYYYQRPLEPIREMFNSDEEYLNARNRYLYLMKLYEEQSKRKDIELKIIMSVVLAFGIVLLTGFAITLYIKSGLIPFIAILLFASLTLFIFKRLKE